MLLYYRKLLLFTLHIPVLHQKATSQIPLGGFEEHTEKLSFHSLGFYCRTSFNRGLQINGRQEAKYISVYATCCSQKQAASTGAGSSQAIAN